MAPNNAVEPTQELKIQRDLLTFSRRDSVADSTAVYSNERARIGSKLCLLLACFPHPHPTIILGYLTFNILQECPLTLTANPFN